MDLSSRFDRWFERLPASPRDDGRVERVVVRPLEGAPGTRETPQSVRVTAEGGVEGDRWSEARRSPGSQVSLINVHVIRDLAGGEEREALCGDNLHVNLDLSEKNLPVGTRLAIGSAVLEVSDEMHRPCGFFAERYGKRAAKRVARATRIGRRGRGVLCGVVRDGAISVGDGIRVLRLARE